MNGVMDDTRAPRLAWRADCAKRSRGSLAPRFMRALGNVSRLCIALAAFSFACDVNCPLRAQDVQNADLPEEPAPTGEVVTQVLIEGNTTIREDAIRALLKSRAGRPLDERAVREDVNTLFRKRWFLNVEPQYRRTDQGLVLVFVLLERPWVRHVEYRGNDRIKTKKLEVETGLKVGSPFDVSANRQAVEHLLALYREKGFINAKIELLKGGDRNDREVIFLIDEGARVLVGRITFIGNTAFSDQLLATKKQTKRAFLGLLGGKYDPNSIPNDKTALQQYYRSLGYFDAKIEEKVTFGRPWWNPLAKKTKWAHIEYAVEEGKRYNVRNIEFEGNQIFSDEQLAKEFKLNEGDPFNGRFLSKDIAGIKGKYGELGRTFATVEATPRFLEDESGVADLIYNIDEDRVYKIRRVDVTINGDYPHTKRTVPLNILQDVAPGMLADPSKIRKAETKLSGSGIFERGPEHGAKVSIKVVEPTKDTELAAYRGQSTEVDAPTAVQDVGFGHSTNRNLSVPAGFVAPAKPTTATNGAASPAPAAPASEASESAGSGSLIDYIFRAQNPGDGLPAPYNPLYESSPQGDPLYPSEIPPGELDVAIDVTEARTGRIMVGAGVNSDSGVVGSIVLSEDNFDILRPPTSFQDILNGTAWRGAGQRFRLEAVPGNIVSRYLVNWTDPYFMDTDYSLGFSAFYYNRFFPDWDEQRTGGRVTLGRQLTPTISVNGAFRLEEVIISNPDTPTPNLLQEVLGSNLLTTFRGAFVHDTRDAAFLPSEGHRVEFSFEQGVGDFNYPRLEVDGAQYFTVYSRPDGGGKHIITARGQVGWTDVGTPIFERYFAGGFQTFRGFDFRGVTPVENGVGIGGGWMALGSLEYMFPLMANDMLQGVVFSDFGTVEDKPGLDEFRITAGAGLRVTIPAMGPAPLAFDWAVPIRSEPTDDERLFTFYVGANW